VAEKVAARFGKTRLFGRFFTKEVPKKQAAKVGGNSFKKY